MNRFQETNHQPEVPVLAPKSPTIYSRLAGLATAVTVVLGLGVAYSHREQISDTVYSVTHPGPSAADLDDIVLGPAHN